MDLGVSFARQVRRRDFGAKQAGKLVLLAGNLKTFLIGTLAAMAAKVKSMVTGFLGLFKKTEQWPALGGSGGPHRMRGPWPRPAPRELWTPPLGWVPPSNKQVSWYDAGQRLVPPVESWFDAGKRL